LSRADGGTDAAFSIEPDELRSLVEETKRAWQALGRVQFGIQKAEENSLRYKRSVYVVEDVQEGELFTKENLRVIRPGDGLAPKYYEKVLGRRASRSIKRATPMSWDLL
jgi:sialic acid synthase SpsE